MRQTDVKFSVEHLGKIQYAIYETPLKTYPFLAFSCMIKFWVWSKSQISREILMIRIHRNFCDLHILPPNIISIPKDFIPVHLVHREISRKA